MVQVSEKDFAEVVLKSEKPVLVFFYRELGCSFCDRMKPLMPEYEAAHPEVLLATYHLGEKPDSITSGLVEKFPTFAAYKDGKFIAKQEGAMPLEQLHLTFDPSKIPPKALPIEKASMLQLMTDEANLIDQLGPQMAHLKKIQKEIKRRKIMLVDEPCCDSCADSGGSCGGGGH
jgi:thiol-disulfide isomerase/thioredoxin